MKMRTIAIASLAMALAVSTARADTLSIPITNATVIDTVTDSGPTYRLLLSFDVPQVLQGKSIEFAHLIMDNPVSESGPTITVQAFPLTTQWDPATVSWTFPWRRHPGGDFDSTIHYRFRIGPQDQFRLFLDLTRFVTGWASGRPNYGILLKRPDYEDRGFGRETRRLRILASQARIKVYYSRSDSMP
jgi:hypothetical protein